MVQHRFECVHCGYRIRGTGEDCETARQAARLEDALSSETEAADDDLVEAEEQLRQVRADELVRQYKAASAERPRSSGEETMTDDEASAEEAMPEKTIGRMRERPPDPDASDPDA